jgi:hypothetical protein
LFPFNYPFKHLQGLVSGGRLIINMQAAGGGQQKDGSKIDLLTDTGNGSSPIIIQNVINNGGT